VYSLSWLAAGLTRPAASQLKMYKTYQLLCIYSEYLLLMGNTCP
jgi:hypothetical protein